MNAPISLLIIEDSDEKAHALANVLDNGGIQCTYQRVQDENSFRKALSGKAYDCIIASYTVETFPGEKSLHSFRQLVLDIPFLFIADSIEAETAVSAIKQGAQDFITTARIGRLPASVRNEIRKSKQRQRQHTELEALRLNEEKFRSLTEHSPAGIFIADNNFKFTYANQVFCQSLGYTREEIIGTDFRHFIHPDSMKQVEKFYRQRQRGEKVPSRYEIKAIRKDGTSLITEVSISILTAPDGSPLTIGEILDITERVQRKTKLTKAARKLERRATQLRVAAEIARETTSAKNLKVLLNRAANLIRERYGFYHAGIFLIDDENRYAVLTASGGNTGQLLVEKHFRIEVGSKSIIGFVAKSGLPRMVNNVTKDRFYRKNPELLETQSELALPLMVDERIIGVLDVQSKMENAFEQDDLQVLQIMADQLAIAIDNVRLFNETRRRAQELSGLYETALMTSSVLETDALLAKLFEQVQKLIHPDTFSIALFDDKTNDYRLMMTIEDGKLVEELTGFRIDTRNGGLTSWVINNRKTLLIHDVEHEKLPAVPILTGRKILSWLGVPLIAHNRVIGAVSVQAFTPNAFNEGHLHLVEALGIQAAIALDNAHLFDLQKQRRQEAENLNEIASALLSTLESDKVIRLVLDRLQDVVPFDCASIQIRQGNLLIVRAVSGHLKPEMIGTAYQIATHSLLEPIITEGKTFVYGDVQSISGWKGIRGEEKIHSWIGVPLLAKEKCIGLLSIGNELKNCYSEYDSHLVRSFANQAAIALENARLFEAERIAREQAETLRDVAETLGKDLDLDKTVRLILTQLKRLITFDTASVILFDKKKGNFVTGIGYKDETLTCNETSKVLDESTVLKKMASELKPVIIPDVKNDPDWIQIPATKDTRSFLGVPIVVHQEMIGAFLVDSYHVNYFNEEDIEPVEALAQHLAIAIENIRLLEKERSQLTLSSSLQQVGMLLTSELGLGVVLEKILNYLGRVVHYDSASIQLLNQDDSFYLAAGRGFPDFRLADGIINNLNSDLIKKRFQDNKAYVINDTSNNPNWENIAGAEYVRSWIGAPLIVRGRLIGILNVDNKSPNAYDESTGNTVLAFASQAAIAIENARLFDAERKARERAEALSEAARVIGSTLSLDEIINAVLVQLARVLPYDSGNVMFIDEDRVIMQAGRGYEAYTDTELTEPVTLSIDNEIIQKLVREKQPVIIRDTKTQNAWEETPVSAHIRSWLGVPLLVRENVIGFLSIDRANPGGYTRDEIALAQAFAAHTSAAIENARIFQKEENRAAALETLRKVNLSLTASLERQSVLNAILEGSFQLLPNISNAHIFLYDQEHDLLSYGSALWRDHEKREAVFQPRDDGLTYSAARQGKAIIIPDVQQNPLFRETASKYHWYGSIASIPLMITDRVIAVINVVSDEKNALNENDIRLLQLLGDQAALAIENAHLFEQTKTERRHLALLYDIGKGIATSLIPNEILKRTIELTCKAMDASLGQACFYNYDDDTLSIQALYGKEIDNLKKFDRNLLKNVSGGLDRWVAEHREPVNIPNTKEDDRWFVLPGLDDDINSALVVPILEADQLLGTLSILSKKTNAFNDDHLSLLQAISQQTSLALSNARRYQDVNRLVDMLAAEQYRLENLIERLPVGIILLDKDYRLQIANPLGSEIVSLLTDAKVGDVLTGLSTIPLAKLVSRHTDPLPIEITIDHPQKRVFEAQVRPLGTGQQQWILLLRDVTQEREFQDHIQMQDRLATVGQLAAGIAHDFNNIMAAIIVYTDLLMLDSNLTKESEERISIIQQQVQRATSLIRQILDFSRRSVMEPNELDLLPFIKEIKKLLERTLPETIHVELVYQDENYQMIADPTRIQQVFMNLAVNARDAMKEGGTLRFELSHLQIGEHDYSPAPDITPGEWIRITVSDTGEGIEQSIIPHIFEPFFTTKPVGEGTGLGLSQVYGIIKQHGGAITLDSKIGEGTNFHIYLPQSSKPKTGAKLPAESSVMNGEERTVLVVEDDHAARTALQTLLEVHNFQVTLASNGKDALRKLEKHNNPFFLVISDLVMPQMGGIDLFYQIEKRWPGTKMLFITGHPLNGETHRLLQEGKVHWLQKPFSIDDFSSAIQSILES